MGFLVYVVVTYNMFLLYLKEIYLTFNSWRPERTADRWSLSEFERNLSEVIKDDLILPIWVKIVLRFKSDLEALLKLAEDDPPEIPVRPHCR